MIIGLGCTAQVGKDTIASYLECKYPKKAKRVAFADKVKDIAMDLFNLSWEQCYGSQESKEALDVRYNMTPREILQGIGHNLRQVYSDVWVNYIFECKIPRLQEDGYSLFVISDVRYPNEADVIHKYGGYVVKVNRPGVGVTVGHDHPSETSMQDYTDFDFTIENTGTLEDLYRKTDELLEKIGWSSAEKVQILE